MNQKFLDPLYGPVELDVRSLEIAFSPEFQRLRYIRLCNINSLFITGASEPKRFEHSIGVFHLAAIWASAKKLGPGPSRILRSAALFHDILTGPFGHSMQYVLEDNPTDQQFEHSDIASGASSQFLQLTQAGMSFAGQPFIAQKLLGDIAWEVFQAVKGEGPFGALIAGTLDLDNLDNVVRLAFHMGLCNDEDRVLPLRLTPLLELHKGQIAALRGAIPLMERWFEIRRRLYEYLLLDRGEFSAKAMLTLAVEEAIGAKIIGTDSWRLTDDELLSHLEIKSVGEDQAIRQYVRRLRVGNLFDCVEVWACSRTDLYEKLSPAAAKRDIEKEIDAAAATKRGVRLRTCVHYILDHKKTCRSLTFHDLETGQMRTVGHDSSSLLVGVFIINERVGEIGEQDRRRYREAALSVFRKHGIDGLTRANAPLGIVQETQPGLFG